jgi:hypothetical protein
LIALKAAALAVVKEGTSLARLGFRRHLGDANAYMRSSTQIVISSKIRTSSSPARC